MSKRIDNLVKRLDKLESSNIKIYLDFIRDFDNEDISYRISVIDRLGRLIDQECFSGLPRVYLDKYQQKYKTTCNSIRLFDLKNGELTEDSYL